MSIRVCQVCSAHRLYDARVYHRISRALAGAGYEVHLIATADSGTVQKPAGVTLHPLPATTSMMERLARRHDVARLAASLGPDVYHVHEPELLGPVTTVAHDRPIVWDVHESFLDVLSERPWLPGWLRPTARLAWDVRERFLMKRVAAVIATSGPIARRYERLGCRVALVRNFTDTAWLSELPHVVRATDTCVFAGSIDAVRGITQAVEAISILHKQGMMAKLDLAGKPTSAAFLAELMERARSLGIHELVRYHGVLPMEQALELQARGSIGLMPYQPIPNFQNHIAIKMIDFMALGLAIVYSDFPNYREIVEGHDCGIAVDPTDPRAIASAIRTLIENPDEARRMGENGRRAVLEHYNWENEKVKLLALYKELLG